MAVFSLRSPTDKGNGSSKVLFVMRIFLVFVFFFVFFFFNFSAKFHPGKSVATVIHGNYTNRIERHFRNHGDEGSSSGLRMSQPILDPEMRLGTEFWVKACGPPGVHH